MQALARMRKGEARKYLFYSLLLFVLAVLPSLHIIQLLKIYDEKRLLEVVLLLLVGVFFATESGFSVFLRDGTKELSFFSKNIKWCVTLFITLGLLSMVFNGGWYYGLQELSLYMLLFAFMIYTTQTYLEQPVQFQRGMLLLLLLFGGLYMIKFFIGYGMHLFIDYPLWPGKPYQYPFFGFSNIRFLNQVQVWTLPLFLIWAPVKNEKNKPWRFLISYCFLFVASLWWMFIIQSAGRGALLSLITAPIFILILFKEKSHQYIKRYLSTFAIGILLKFLLFDILTGGVSKSLLRNSGSAGRLERWGKMLVDIAGKPFIGYGPMSFAKISDRYHVGHPHNSVLQIGYEFGLPALCIALGLLLFGLYKWYKHRMIIKDANKTDNSNIRVGISTALLAGLGYSLFSGVIVMPLSQLWLALIGGWAVGIYAGQTDAGGLPQQSDGSRRKTKDLAGFGKLAGLALKTIVLAALLFMSCSMITEVPRLKENQHRYIMKYGGKFHPRFWQQGRLRQGYGD